MNINLNELKIGILGGNYPCKTILEILLNPSFEEFNLKIVAIADTITQCEGVKFANQKKIYTTTDYNEFFKLENIDTIFKLKDDEALNNAISKNNVDHSKIIDLNDYEAILFLQFLNIEKERLSIKQKINSGEISKAQYCNLLFNFSSKIHTMFAKEISCLKSEKESFLEIEDEMFQIIQGSVIPTFIINKDHIVTNWNKALEELTGQKAYGIVGTDRQWKPFRKLPRPTLADVVVGEMKEDEIKSYYGDSWRKSSLLREAYEAEEFFSHLGENGKWIFFTASPIKSPDGEIIGAIQTLDDLTEYRETQKTIRLKDQKLLSLNAKIKESEHQYRSLFNNNPNPLFIIDRQNLEILDVNNRVIEDYGFLRSEIIGKSFLKIGYPDDESIKSGLNIVDKDQSILLTKKKHYRKTEQGKAEFFVNIKVVHAMHDDKDVLIASVTDITESIETETQLIQAGKLATLGTMAAGMAHEINQPLNVIQICADLILKMIKKGHSISDDELMSMAKDIIDNVARASGVIKHVRDFARQSERDVKKLDINSPLNDVFKVLGHQLANHKIKVNFKLAPDLPKINAEHNRLEQVFINLVTNAIDAMDEKQIVTKYEKRLNIETYHENDNVVIKVSDNGVGMTDKVKAKIFEPFFTTKTIGKGTGLGTSISFGIVKDYKGTIAIKSEYGEGTEFIIKFPEAK